ncbi:MAG TPA: hypothetical protein ENL44_00795 [Thermoplasmatales archaeon]|nr:hypothetical protein [Thermoplasmatales archaeon]
MREALIELEMDSEREATIIYESVYPEVRKKIPKTTVSLDRKGKKLILKIKSRDTSSLRAACNSFLRWIETAKSVSEIF